MVRQKVVLTGEDLHRLLGLPSGVRVVGAHREPGRPGNPFTLHVTFEGDDPGTVQVDNPLAVELARAVNGENGSDTPDFILGFLARVLRVFDTPVRSRDAWYERDAASGGVVAGPLSEERAAELVFTAVGGGVGVLVGSGRGGEVRQYAGQGHRGGVLDRG